MTPEPGPGAPSEPRPEPPSDSGTGDIGTGDSGTGDIGTGRLVLRRFTLARAQDVLAGSTPASQRWAAGYPLDDEVGLLRLVIAAATEPAGWGPWQILDRPHHRLRAIGGIGFLGGPDELGEVEVGFGLVPAVRGAGLATEALTALIGWAFGHGARVVHATTTVHNVASQRTMTNAGMRMLAGPQTEVIADHGELRRFAARWSR